MLNPMRSRHLQQHFNMLVIVLAFALSFAWLPTEASALSQASDCRISVQPGWSPRRVEEGDTLEMLAARSGVTVDELLQVNCLESTTIAVGALVLTPKLGPIIPTATPTAMPTEAPIATPTTEPTPTKPMIVVVDESSTATPTSSNTETMTTTTDAEETATNMAAENAQVTPMTEVIDPSTEAVEQETADNAVVVVAEPTVTPTAVPTEAMPEDEAQEDEEKQEEDDAIGMTTPSSGGSASFPLGTRGLIGISLFIMGAVSALFFALQPRRQGQAYHLKSGTAKQYATVEKEGAGGVSGGIFVNIAFMIGGFVIGAVLFPMLRMPGFVELPTWLSATAAIGLITLLAVKEVLLGAMQWRGLNRVLNLGIAPLLMIFVLSVVSRFAGM